MEKDLQNKEAVTKLKSAAEDIKFCMYTTYKDGKIESRPMTTLQIDAEGNAWFFTSRKTEIGSETSPDEAVTLIYSDPKNNTYLSVSGSAAVIEDQAKKDELWGIMSKAWFPEGKDDPNVVLLKVTTDEAAYWDNTSSQMIVFFSMVKAVLTGTTPDGGDYGKMNLA